MILLQGVNIVTNDFATKLAQLQNNYESVCETHQKAFMDLLDAINNSKWELAAHLCMKMNDNMFAYILEYDVLNELLDLWYETDEGTLENLLQTKIKIAKQQLKMKWNWDVDKHK